MSLCVKWNSCFEKERKRKADTLCCDCKKKKKIPPRGDILNDVSVRKHARSSGRNSRRRHARKFRRGGIYRRRPSTAKAADVRHGRGKKSSSRTRGDRGAQVHEDGEKGQRRGEGGGEREERKKEPMTGMYLRVSCGEKPPELINTRCDGRNRATHIRNPVQPWPKTYTMRNVRRRDTNSPTVWGYIPERVCESE